MECRLGLVLGCLLLVGPAAIGQNPSQPVRSRPVSLIQLLANPVQFDGKLVTVGGFLTLGEHPEFVGQQPLLYLHQEDAKNLLLGNSVWIVPSEEMRHDREKIDSMYVNLTGVFHAGRGSVGGTINEVQKCAVWSNPEHPLGLKGNAGRYK